MAAGPEAGGVGKSRRDSAGELGVRCGDGANLKEDCQAFALELGGDYWRR